MLIGMSEDIKRDLNSINKEAAPKNPRLKMVKRFKEIVQFNFDAKQFSKHGRDWLKIVESKIRK